MYIIFNVNFCTFQNLFFFDNVKLFTIKLSLETLRGRWTLGHFSNWWESLENSSEHCPVDRRDYRKAAECGTFWLMTPQVSPFKFCETFFRAKRKWKNNFLQGHFEWLMKNWLLVLLQTCAVFTWHGYLNLFTHDWIWPNKNLDLRYYFALATFWPNSSLRNSINGIVDFIVEPKSASNYTLMKWNGGTLQKLNIAHYLRISLYFKSNV